MQELKWGVIGTGAIARTFAFGLTQSSKGSLVAVGSRNQATADAFADEWDVPARYGSYEALLAAPEVDAVYISPPHPWHAEWAIKAAEAGKHILCEKPMCMCKAEAMAVIEAARENRVFLMEAFMYRCHPQTQALVDLVKSGAIGQVRMIRAAFAFGGGDNINADSRLFANNMGGGGILDVGCYAVSASRLIAGAALGLPFANPITVVGAGRVGETDVDEWAGGVLKFDNDIIAQVTTGIRCTADNIVEIYGSEGRITVPNPWVADRKNGVPGRIHVRRGGQEEVIHEQPVDRTAFSLEADVVADAIAHGDMEAPSPAMTWEDTLGNLAALDAWRDAVGVQYAVEATAGTRPIRALPLTSRPSAPMTYGTIPGLDRPVSKLILGHDNKNLLRDAAPLWDAWFACGGNTMDTAWLYGRGRQVMLRQWLRSRGVRDNFNILCKGAHTPKCNPNDLTQQLMESLEDFGVDRVDIYVMHRDNPDVPVGEFIDVLNEHVDAGRIGIFGGSNWSLERFREANAYAAAHGKRPMTVMSNNLSLARMVNPVWRGCVHVSDAESRRWLEQSGTPNLSWSSQARGYFVPPELRDETAAKTDDSWDAPDNQARRERARELAAKKGVSALNIATAYVLSQPFPSFALIGPRTIHELLTTLPALGVTLTPEELAWLWGE